MTPQQIERALELATTTQLASALARKGGTGGPKSGTGPKTQYVACKHCKAKITRTQALRGHGCR